MLLRARSRGIWHDPSRTLLTLDSFARTEEDGGRDIASAARRVSDPELANHLHRHAADEVKHAGLFKRRAAELRTAGGAVSAAAREAEVASDSAYDLSRGRPSTEVDAHGFLTLGLLDELGEVPYVAMLHVAEVRAAALFHVHHDLTRHDPETCAIFEEILRDENYHVAWTAAMLKTWRAAGRDEEVTAALKSARANRWLSAWKRLGVRSGGHFGRVVLVLLYGTLLAPFGLAARRGRNGQAGWRGVPGNAQSPALPPATPASAAPAHSAATSASQEAALARARSQI